MKILVSAQYCHPPRGGAEVSLCMLIDELVKTHEVTIMQEGKINDVIRENNLTIRYVSSINDPHCLYPIIWKAKAWKKAVREVMDEQDFDLVITQLCYAAPTIDIASLKGVKSVFFVRSYEHFCPNGFVDGIECDHRCLTCIKLKHRTHYLDYAQWKAWNSAALSTADIVISNSEFMAEVVHREASVKSEVLYPAVVLLPEKVALYGREYYSMVNPIKRKGGDIFRELAVVRKDKQFLSIGKYVKGMESRVNLDRKEMSEAYNQTKILFAPAVWPEPFGRTPIEAGCYWVPTIARKIGGLPESVGDGGVLVDSNDVSDWNEAIDQVEGKYSEYSYLAWKNAEQFDIKKIYSEFEGMLRKAGIDI